MNIPVGKWLATLSKPERYLAYLFGAGLIISFLWLLAGSYLEGTAKAPAFGGTISIGLLGSPHSINPVLSAANEVDQALVKLLYPSLLHYNNEGELVPYLAKDFAIGEEGKIYDFFLQENILWDDGTLLTAHDVVFTIKIIQNQKIASPLFRIWEGVTVQALNDTTVRFTLLEPYAFFLQNVTVGILPQHIWEPLEVAEFALAEQNKEPIGAGPYQFGELTKSNGTISALTLRANPQFFGKPPFIPNITVRFYATPQHLLEAFQKREITMVSIPFESSLPELDNEPGATVTSFILPRYFALFLNEHRNAAFEKKEVRQALLRAIDRDAVLSSVFANRAEQVTSPIPSILQKYHNPNLPTYPFSPGEAKKQLEASGFSQENPLTIELTVVNGGALREVAQAIAGYWESIGVEVTINSIEITRLRDKILQDRTYEAFLFGQALALEPDPFSLWHSSQSEYPGLNLTSYKNPELDAVLEELRQTFDEKKRQELFYTFQSIIMEDLPALFLYSPHHLVLADNDIQGIVSTPLSFPEDYLNQITQWYIYTKRMSK